jgi:hypothetical protein
MVLKLYQDYKDLNLTKDKQASFEDVLGGAYKERKISQILPDYLYTVFRAVTANVPNMNADQFDDEELNRYDIRQAKKVYETFNGRSIFTNHQAEKVENSIGVIFDSYYDRSNADDMFVEIVMGIDKKKAGDIARGVETGRLRNGSMGCSITHSICTLCGTSVKTEKDFCTCLRNHRGGIYKGQRVAEKLRGVNFQEYSIVTVGADPKANMRYIISSVIDYKRLPKAAESADIFNLMKILVHEVQGASLNDRMKVAQNLDTVLSNIEGIKYTVVNEAASTDINKSIDNKLTRLFDYVRNSQFCDLGGPVNRSKKKVAITLENAREHLGKEIELDDNGVVYALS